MNAITTQLKSALLWLAMLATLGATPALAGGEVGEHVHHLSDNIEKYSDEVIWFNNKVDEIVNRYEKDGAKAANSDAIIAHWEAVNFHAAIESNYMPLYASIWQGMFAVKESIDKSAEILVVRKEQQKLEQVLWQALGAVKLAGQFQDRGLLAKVKLRQGNPSNSMEVLDAIKLRLDRALAKFAEKEVKKSMDIVYDTYLNLFEGVEGELIALDADLVEDLEKDFNVTLPKALKGKASVDDVRQIIANMGAKINNGINLLTDKSNKKKDVF